MPLNKGRWLERRPIDVHRMKSRVRKLRTSIVAFLVTILLSSMVNAAWYLPCAIAAPQIVVDKTQHDFGDVFAGEVIACGFTLKNLGTAPLHLSDKPIMEEKKVSRAAFTSLPFAFSLHLPMAAVVGRKAPT